MSRNNILLVVLLVVLGGVALIAYKVFQEEGDGNGSSADGVTMCGKSPEDQAMTFVVKDTATVDKFVIEDAHARRAILERKNGQWSFQSEVYNADEKVWVKGKVYRARKDAVDLILKTFHNIEFKHFVPDNAKETMTKQMLATYKKVDIYKSGTLHKSWYVGMATSDHHGTYMIIETPECGRSPYPFVMGAYGFNGTLWVRFFTEEHEWRYTGIWNGDPDEIAQIEVTNHEHPDSSFTLTHGEGEDFGLINSEGQNIKNPVRGNIANYFRNFRRLNFEKFEIQRTQEEVDSIMHQAPLYFTISTLMKDGSRKSLKIKKRKLPPGTTDITGKLIEWDVDRLYGIMDDETLVVIQYHVFGYLFKDIKLFMLPS